MADDRGQSTTSHHEFGSAPPHAHQAKWQTWAVVLVVVGCLATVAYAVVENFWG
jgi:hypothetical protein